MAKITIICPKCEQPIRRKDKVHVAGGKAYHRDCPAPVGRPRTERGRGSPIVGVRLSVVEAAALEQKAEEQDTTPAELLRRAYFGED